MKVDIVNKVRVTDSLTLNLRFAFESADRFARKLSSFSNFEDFDNKN